MRLSYESIVAPENGTSGVPADDQTLLSGITVDATKLNMLTGVTGNIQSRLNLAVGTGGTLTGNVVLNGAPSVGLHAASKAYVDGLTVSGKLSSSGGTMTGALTLSGVATSALGAITKQQMDDAIAAAGSGGGGGSLIENWPRWDTNPSEQVGLGWTTFQSKLNALITEVRKAPLASYSKNTPGSYLPFGNNMGSILLPDGRVFLGPGMGTSAIIYDPATDTVKTTPSVFPGNHSFWAPVLLNNGKVFIPPRLPVAARIYDPATDTVIISNGNFSSLDVNGAIVLKDGRVFMTPGVNNYNPKLYDPLTDTVTTSAVNVGSEAFRGNNCLLPDGRVLIITKIATVSASNLGTKAFIYNPVTDTLSAEIIIENNILSGFNSSVLLPNGKVFIAPGACTTARIFDPVTLAVTIPSGTYISNGVGSYIASCLLPDGRVFIAPYGANSAYIYDYITDSLTTAPGSYYGGIRSITLLPDGRLYLAADSSVNITFASASVCSLQGNKKLPNNLLLSPFMTSRFSGI